MILSGAQVQNFRSIIDSTWLPFGPITILVGRNNAGKSAFLRAVYQIQDGSTMSEDDIRIGSEWMRIGVGINDLSRVRSGGGQPPPAEFAGGRLSISVKRDQSSGYSTTRSIEKDGFEPQLVNSISHREPNNLIFPSFTGRRQQRYQQQVQRGTATTIVPGDDNLVARVMDLGGSGSFAEAKRFRALCREILGVDLQVFSGDTGQAVGVKIDRFNQIYLESMGAGLSGTLGLIANLSTARNQILIVEEPENDLHPAALKVLCEAMRESVEKHGNQIVLSTHSSIVVTKLGSVPDAVVLHVESDGMLPPASEFKVVSSRAGRLAVLHDLGYELADLDLGDGWIFLEESSAQRIIRDFLIPLFVPYLARLNVISATGISRVKPIMIDFKEMFLFAHLEQLYRNRAWLFVDGGDVGKATVDELRGIYSGWSPDRFQTWGEDQFEKYYPEPFGGRVKTALAASDKKKKRELKKLLLLDVVKWLDEDLERARVALKASAAEVIEKLEKIEQEFKEMALKGNGAV